MNIKERNQKIREYLIQHPIQKGSYNAYKEVCEKFGVNKDVVKGVIRTAEGRRKITKSDEDFLPSNLCDISKPIKEFIEEQVDLSKSVVTQYSVWQQGEKTRFSVKVKPKDDSLIENEVSLLDSLKNYFIENPVTPKLQLNTNYNKNTAINVYLSDLHVGAMIESDSLYENKYDKDVLKNRINYILERLLDYKNLYGKFQDIFIINLGDTLDGFNHQTTRGGHYLPQNLNNKEQFETYFSIMRNFFDNLIELDITKNINFYSVGDSNHDGDLQYIVNRTLEIYLNSTYKNIITQVFNKFIGHYVYNDHTFIITHGKDKINMKHGLPFNLNDKTENFINDYIYQHDIRTPNIHLVKGDLHQSATQFGKRFRYKNCMSMMGGSGWSITNFGSFYAGVDIDIIGHNGSVIEDRIFFRRNF